MACFICHRPKKKKMEACFRNMKNGRITTNKEIKQPTTALTIGDPFEEKKINVANEINLPYLRNNRKRTSSMWAGHKKSFEDVYYSPTKTSIYQFGNKKKKKRERKGKEWWVGGSDSSITSRLARCLWAELLQALLLSSTSCNGGV